MNEHIKGPWHSDGNHVRNKGGLIATAMIAVRMRDRIDETRLDGESWMAMHDRTKPLREENEEIEKDLLTLIAAAPEMLEVIELYDVLFQTDAITPQDNQEHWKDVTSKVKAILQKLYVPNNSESGD